MGLAQRRDRVNVDHERRARSTEYRLNSASFALGSFVFRTTGFNSIRTLIARLQYFRAISGDRLACLPLELRLCGKSTRQSHGTPIFYVDLTLRSGMTVEQALLTARELDEARQAAGFDQAALDATARVGLGNGIFEDDGEDNSAIAEEFFPDGQPAASKPDSTVHTQSLAEKLGAQSQQLEPSA